MNLAEEHHLNGMDEQGSALNQLNNISISGNTVLNFCKNKFWILATRNDFIIIPTWRLNNELTRKVNILRGHDV